MAVQHDAEVEVEPVDTGAFGDCEFDVAIGLHQPPWKCVGDVDLPAILPQVRNVGKHEVQPSVRVRVGDHEIRGVRMTFGHVTEVFDAVEADMAKGIRRSRLGGPVTDKPEQHAVILDNRLLPERFFYWHFDGTVLPRQPGQGDIMRAGRGRPTGAAADYFRRGVERYHTGE